MPEPTRRSQQRNFALYSGAILLALTFAGTADAQQAAPAASTPPAACLGYSYNTRPSFFIREGISTVMAVIPGSPAEAGGLKAEDVLFTTNGVRVGSTSPASAMSPGDTVRMVVLRGDQTVELTVVTGERIMAPGGSPNEMVCRAVQGPRGNR